MLVGVVAEGLLLANAAIIVEAISATDAVATGNVVFATLVDDPAAVGDTVDAYLGDIMLEAASADAAVDAGLVYVAGIDEEITAVEAYSGAVPTALTDSVDETAAAVSTQDATVTGAIATTALVVNELSVAFVTPSPNSVNMTNSATLLTVQ